MSQTSGAREQVARLLALVPYLATRGEVRLSDAAQHLDVSEAQVVKDLKVLFMVGLPGGYPDDLIDVDIDALEGEGVIRVSNADYLGRPVRFAPAEATALVVALRTMLEDASGDSRSLIERTLAKIEGVAAADQAPTLHVAPDERARHPHLPEIERAIAGHRQLRISYFVPSRDAHSERVVDPRQLAQVDGLVYLDAYCHLAEADRAFRVDRIVAASVLDTPVTDPSARPRDLTRDWFTGQDTPLISLRLAPQAAWVTEYYPVTDVRPVGDGRLDVTLAATSHEWALQLLGKLAPHVEVVQPTSLRDEFRQRMQSTLELYHPSVRGSGG